MKTIRMDGLSYIEGVIKDLLDGKIEIVKTDKAPKMLPGASLLDSDLEVTYRLRYVDSSDES